MLIYNNGYDELYHYGTKGQHWGKRRYQNADGSLTPEGRIHYGYGEGRVKNAIIGNTLGPGFAKAKSSEGYLTAYANKSYRRNLRAQRFVDKFNIVNKDARQAAWKKSKVNRNVKNRLKTDEQYNKRIAEVMDRRRQNVKKALPAFIATAVIGSAVSTRLMSKGMNHMLLDDDKLGKILMGSGYAASIGATGLMYGIGRKVNKEWKETMRKDIKNNGK